MSKITLRALTEADMELTLRWHNSDDIKLNYAGHPFPVNREMEKKWYDRILYENIPVTVFGIEITDSKELVGLVMIKGISLINRSAEFSIYIGDEKNRGKGYAAEATREAIRFAFDKIGLHRLWLCVMAENAAAVKLYESAGFIKEGILKQSIFKDGSFRDEVIYALVKEK